MKEISEITDFYIANFREIDAAAAGRAQGHAFDGGA